MDYQNALENHLLSTENIDLVVDAILKNFKISQKAITKCTNIITNNFVEYLNNLDRYPQNDQEFVEAITFLNDKCYNDFRKYLSQRYPNVNLERETSSTIKKHNFQHKLNDNTNKNDFDDSDIYQEMEIITEEEKNKLLAKYQKNDNGNKTNELLSYLTNPQILQMFYMMTNQVTTAPVSNKLQVDEVLDAKQVQELLNNSFKKVEQNTDKKFINNKINHTDPPNENVPEYPEDKPEITKTKKKVEFKLDDNTTTEAIVKQPEVIPGKKIDLTKLTKDMLPTIQKRLTELLELKNKYLIEDDVKMVNQIDTEKEQLMAAVRNFKNELEKEARESENKISGLSMSKSKRPDDGDNVEYLDLKFDPTNNFNDLKNIIIKFKTDDKITDISLIDYYLPFNENNVNRFNNKFVVYFNNNITRINIPPGKYEIKNLLDYIKSKVTFLDFTINENNIITIKNTMDMKFDLMLDGDTIFPLLGFNGKMDSYKEKLMYSAAVPYNINPNEKVLFTLSGSTMEPMEMEFDKEVVVNKSLKKSRAGVVMKQIVLHFSDVLNMCYDFVMPFKMCFKITYLAK